MNKLPPIEKIYEAFSAIADGRIAMEENQALVRSSNGAKAYTVQWDDSTYSSNDSATYWQLYAGYPVLAVLMLQGRLPFRKETADWFSGIDWTELNARHRRNYAQAAAEVLARLKERGADAGAIEKEAGEIYQAAAKLDIAIKRSPLRPPK